MINPVQIIRSYFKLCGFKFGLANGDQSFVNCVMRRKKACWTADGRRSISYSTSTRDVRNVLAAAGIFVEKASDKSFKMLGVTMTLESGTALENVRDQGCWRTLSMPLHYKTNSDQFKKSVASQVPVRIIRATTYLAFLRAFVRAFLAKSVVCVFKTQRTPNSVVSSLFPAR